MVLETIISSKYRIATIVTLAILAAGLLGQLISSAIWWSRLQPWFGYGRGYYRVVYNCVFACFILSLIAFAVLVVIGAINIFAKELYAKITGSLLGTILVITIVGACALAGLIPGAYGASWAVDRYKPPTLKPADEPGTNGFKESLYRLKGSLEKLSKDANSHFCAGYVFGLAEIPEKNDWPEKSKKRLDYDEWSKKLAHKALEAIKVEKNGSLSEYIVKLMTTLYNMIQNADKLGLSDSEKEDLQKAYGLIEKQASEPIPDLPNSYLCEEVGLPTLIFTMVTGLSMIIFFYLIVINAYSQSDASEAEA